MATKKTVAKRNSMQAFAPFVARAKDAQAKLAGRRAELVAFNNDNLSAMKVASQAFVTGVKPLVELAAGNARNQVQAFRATAASFKGVKSPTEAFKLQVAANKVAIATAREDTKAFGQAVVKLAGETGAPLKDRFAAVRKLAA